MVCGPLVRGAGGHVHAGVSDTLVDGNRMIHTEQTFDLYGWFIADKS